MRGTRDGKTCPVCGGRTGFCVECNDWYPLGSISHCTKPECIEVNAPVACRCGLDVAGNLSGVIDQEGVLHEFE